MSHLVVALPSEARPLTAHFGLRAVKPRAPFRLYRSDELWLVVSGVGKTLSAAATAYLFAAAGAQRDRPWINVGIAGHATLAVGEGLVAHEVEDAGSGRVWHPRPGLPLPVATGTVRTLDRAADEYPAVAACDMEAAGFLAAACRFAPVELIHVYKVVSDGPDTDRGALTAARVAALVAPHVEAVEQLLAATDARADEIAAGRLRFERVP